MKKISLLTILFTFFGLTIYYVYPESKLKDGQKADRIVINKSKHELKLFYKKELLATYVVSLSSKGLNKKTKAGDSLTPEGVFKAKKRTFSNFHRAIEIGVWGSDCNVLIHGLKDKYRFIKKFHRFIDWTDGCVALTNTEIEEIYNAINNNTTIEINS